MIAYFTKQYQAVPALMPLYQSLGGTFVSTRASTIRAIRQVYPDTNLLTLHESLGRFSSGDRRLRAAQAIFTGSPNRELLVRYSARSYMVFHGTYAFMAQREIAALQHFDRICVIGPRMFDTLAGSGLEDKLISAGYLPFLDFPERDSASREMFLKGIGLDPTARTLLYLPRGKPYGSWEVMAEKLLRDIPRHYNLVLRPHPSQSVSARLDDRIGFRQLQAIARERGNALVDLTSCKLSTLFSVADLVITDGASSPEEALYYDMPLLFIESQGSSPDAIAAMMRELKISEEYIGRLLAIYNCGGRITTESADIADRVRDALETSEHFRPQRQAYYAWAFGERGLVQQQAFIARLAEEYSAR